MKYFYKPSTRRQLRKLICSFAKEQGITRVVFSPFGKGTCGTYHSYTKTIFINLKQTMKGMLSTFLHELGHHIAVLQGKWLDFHFQTTKPILAGDMFYIENQIDQIAKELWYKYVDLPRWGKYKYFYPKKSKNIFIMNHTSLLTNNR